MRTVSLAISCVLSIACTGDSGGGDAGDGETTAPGSEGPATSSTASTDAGTSSASTTTAADADTGAAMPCASNDDCPATYWCDFADDSCGASGVDGACIERPTDCTADDRPVCGCDAQVYPSPCHGAADGVDLAFLSECETPNGAFDCGYSYCIGGAEACVQMGGDMPTFECVELPPVCDPPECSCMTDCCGCDNATCCARFCTIDGDNITITCPGG